MKQKSGGIVIVRLIIIGLLVGITLIGCESTISKGKGELGQMETYYVGRFSIALPAEMKQAARAHGLRDTEIKEVVWPRDKKSEEARKEAWDSFIDEVKTLEPPDGTTNVIVKMRDFPDVGYWAKGALYHGDSGSIRTATWRLLVDIGSSGIWLNTSEPVVIEKDAKSDIVNNNFTNIAKSYHVIDSNAPRQKGDWFYLQHGAINLPYKWQEASYVRFEGHPLNLKLEIKMNETYKVEPGLIERTNSGMNNILGKYVTGVSVDRIRSRKRAAAGLDGEEEIHRMSEKSKKMLYFHWEYAGKENSGKYPEIALTMDTPDGNLEEKLKIWDAVLDSMRPMYK